METLRICLIFAVIVSASKATPVLEQDKDIQAIKTYQLPVDEVVIIGNNFADFIKEIIQKCRSPDGLTGDELRNIPEEIFTLYANLQVALKEMMFKAEGQGITLDAELDESQVKQMLLEVTENIQRKLGSSIFMQLIASQKLEAQSGRLTVALYQLAMLGEDISIVIKETFSSDLTEGTLQNGLTTLLTLTRACVQVSEDIMDISSQTEMLVVQAAQLMAGLEKVMLEKKLNGEEEEEEKEKEESNLGMKGLSSKGTGLHVGRQKRSSNFDSGWGDDGFELWRSDNGRHSFHVGPRTSPGFIGVSFTYRYEFP